MLRNLIYTLIFSSAVSTAWSQSVGGTLNSANTQLCSAVNSGSITLSGHTGNVIRWEYSVSGGDPWTPIVNVSGVYNFTNLSQSTHFRAVVQAPGFLPAYSSTIGITVYPASDGGIISGPASVCSGNTVRLSVSGQTGQIMGWEKSLTSGSTWLPVSPSTDSTGINEVISQPVIYRLSVQSGSCPMVNSNQFSITTSSSSVAGTISGPDSICQNTGFTLTAAGFSGAVNWQVSAASSGPWTNLGVTAPSLMIPGINSTSYYRTNVQSGSCPAAISAVHSVHVSLPSAGGNIQGPSSSCESDSTVYTAVNFTGTITNWETNVNGGGWTLMGTNAPSVAPQETEGTYSYRTTVKNGVCPSVLSQVFTTIRRPLPAVNFSVTNMCEEQQFSINNTTSGAINYNWDFGDGTGSTAAQPVHSYSGPGNYTVRLLAASQYNCTDTGVVAFHVYQKPEALFTTDLDTICQFDEVTFLNSSQSAEGSITAYSWKKGTTVFSTDVQPQLTPQEAGTDNITLTVITSNGCADSTTGNLIVRPKPQADFYAENTCLGNAVAFQNLSQLSAGTYLNNWSFGDAGFSSIPHPSHNYAAAGNYNVQLIVRSSFLCSDTALHQITVNTINNADFTVNSPCLEDDAAFTPENLDPSVTDISWQFGDGAVSSDDTTFHLYLNYGTFMATLVYTSDSGCVSQITKSVTVHPLPQLSFSLAGTCENYPLEVNNYSQIATGTLSYDWDFGGFFNSTDQDPEPVAAMSGTYDATLIAESDHGCRDTLVHDFTIYDQPLAQFSFSNVCDGSPIAFTNGSTVSGASITNYNWNFGDNTTSNVEDPEKNYLNEGNYDVTLIVESSNGCTDTSVMTVNIYEAPIADFDVQSVCFGEVSAFVNTSQITLGTISSEWNFGDNENSVLFAPNHAYTAPGDYLVTLVATSDQGCSDTISEYVYVYGAPVVDAGENITIEKGFSIELNATGAEEYIWSPAAGLSNPQIDNPVADPEETTLYQLTGINEYGCIGKDSVLITVDDTYKVIPHNFLSPDVNGKNDTWIVGNIDAYTDNEIIIMNENGSEVFKTTAYDNSWDGRNKTGEILPDGVYYYLITFDGSDKKYSGEILLMRNSN